MSEQIAFLLDAAAQLRELALSESKIASDLRRMRMTRTGLIAAAMLASPGTVKCWDSVTNQVRNETPSTSSGSSTSTSGVATGSTAIGSTSSSTRPSEAAGLPDCRS
jgi:hypothetical protein